ncbi:TPA: hypothetical protein ACJI8J_002546 [Kluyvera georgiana]|uniref:hypothetical protein n=1 Tax=Kluyvera georgiana TaxID=73098 RepID=UPI0012ED48B6|nr:hypothetical protein [Kluyvera georgiana]
MALYENPDLISGFYIIGAIKKEDNLIIALSPRPDDRNNNGVANIKLAQITKDRIRAKQ